MLLDKYIEFVMRKKLTKPDERLLDVLGFKDAFKLITDAKAEKQQERDMIISSGFGA